MFLEIDLADLNEFKKHFQSKEEQDIHIKNNQPPQENIAKFQVNNFSQI